MSGLIHKYSDIQTHKDTERAHALMKRFQEQGPHSVGLTFAGSPLTGAVVLIDSPGEPPCVLETVTSVGGLEASEGVDFVTEPTVVSCLYRAHPLFADADKLIAARKEVIETLTDFSSAYFEPHPKGAVIRCPVRGFPVFVRELTFMQLLDTMKYLTAKYMQ